MVIMCYRKCRCTLITKQQCLQRMTDTDSRDVKTCAGVCVISSKGILVNQAYQMYWGIPKGVVEDGENIVDCALRELKEETGIVIESRDLSRYIFNFKYKNIKRQVFIFFAYVDDTSIEADNLDPECTGYGFVFPRCLNELFYSRQLKLNYFTRVLLNKFFV